MSKRSSTHTNYDIIKMLSFIVLILAAVIMVLQACKVNLSVLSMIKDIALIAVVALSAYPFARSLRWKGWMIIYWIIVAVIVVAFILGTVLL